MADVSTSGGRNAAAGASASGAAASGTSTGARGAARRAASGAAEGADGGAAASAGAAGDAGAQAARGWLGRTFRGRGERAAAARAGAEGERSRPSEPTGRAAAERGRARAANRTDWERIGVFGAGLAIGALLGAGVALLAAPASGFETRARLALGARRARGRVADRFDEITDDVRRSARRGVKSARRKMVRSRWAAEDLIDSRSARRARGIARDARA